MGLGEFFRKIIHAVTWFVTRPGITNFLEKYAGQAMAIVAGLAQIHSNAGFHSWKDEAFAEVKKISGDVSDNWIAILIHVAYENLKAHGITNPAGSS